jgi:hypothetical protein
MSVSFLQVTHSVSMPTTLLSAGLLKTPFHSRTWSLLAVSEPVSERHCCFAHLSLMVRWSTLPCSGPVYSEQQRSRGCGWAMARSFLDVPKLSSTWRLVPSCLSMVSSDPRVLNTTAFLGSLSRHLPTVLF